MNQAEKLEPSFQFKDYQKTFCENVRKFLSNGTFADVTLVCNGEEIRAHRVVLSAFSEVFENFLYSRSEPHTVLIFNDIPKEEMVLVINYMYRAEVTVPENQVPAFLECAKKLKLRGVDYTQITSAERYPVQEVQVNEKVDLPTVVSETPAQNEKGQSEEPNIEDHGLVSKRAPKWLSAPNNSSKRREYASKVINPYAKRRSKNLSNDSDSTVFDYDPAAPGPSKNSLQNSSLLALSTPIRNDSDIEFVENDMSVVVVTDTQAEKSPDLHKTPTNHKRKRSATLKTTAQFNEAEFTSDESDLVSTPTKSRWNRIVDHSEQNSNAGSSVKVNPVALKNKRDADMDRSKEHPDPRRGNKRSTSKENDSAEPFGGYVATRMAKLKSFCVICRKCKCQCKFHIKKKHSYPLKGKSNVCRTCSKKFSLAKALELHRCEPLRKRK